MSSNQAALEEKNIQKLKVELTEENFPENNSKTINQDDFEKDLENYHPKRKYRNSVYTERKLRQPKQTDENSSFMGINNSYDYDDFLKKKHLFIISKYEQIVLLSSDLNKKLEENAKAIEDLNNELKRMKEDKKKKQSDIVNYLANKESLLEIYKNKISYLVNQKKESNTDLDKSKSSDKDESQLYDIDLENEIEIKVEEIKNSDKAKFSEDVINFTEELFNKKEEPDLKEKIESKVNIAYNIFFSEISSNITINDESIISHFFSRIGLFISNHSLGLYSEKNINKFLRYLLKINSTDVEISKMMKFLDKKYKERKVKIKEQIKNLKETMENLKEKKNVNDIKIEKYEKIIQKNKELIKNAKQEQNDEDTDGKKKTRRYTVFTLKRENLRRDKFKPMFDENVDINNDNADIKTKPKKSKFYKEKKVETEEKISKKTKNKEEGNKVKDIDSGNNSKNQGKNQKFIVIKNNINIKNAKGSNEANNKDEKEKNIPFKEKNNDDYKNIKYNENIYIINNINNSEQVQTKNNIYDNKANNLNINSNNNINEGSKSNNKKVNNINNQRKNSMPNPIPDNNKNVEKKAKKENPSIPQKTSQKITDTKTQGIQGNFQKSNPNNKNQSNNTPNTYGRSNDNKKIDNNNDDKNIGYKTTVLPKRSERKAE